MVKLDDWEIEPSGTALSLLENEYLQEIFDALEKEAIERGLSAAHPDHETRLYAAMTVEAIRSVRGQLAARAAGKAKPRRTDPAA